MRQPNTCRRLSETTTHAIKDELVGLWKPFPETAEAGEEQVMVEETAAGACLSWWRVVCQVVSAGTTFFKEVLPSDRAT